MDERLSEIRAREAAATPGPWEHDDLDRFRVQDSGRGNMVCRTMSNEPNPREQWADAEFIAAARSDIPDLLAHIAALTAALTAARAREAALVAAGSRLFACIETTEDIWMNEVGTHEIACACCGRQAIGNRENPAVIEHLETCDVVAWRAALAAATPAEEDERL